MFLHTLWSNGSSIDTDVTVKLKMQCLRRKNAFAMSVRKRFSKNRYWSGIVEFIAGKGHLRLVMFYIERVLDII